MKEHTCIGIEEAKIKIDKIKSDKIKDNKVFPCCLPVFIDNGTSAYVYYYGEYDDFSNLRIEYFKIKFFPFCGFEYKEKNK